MSTVKTAAAYIPLADAAMRLRMPYRSAYDLALSGHLGEPFREGRRLMVSTEAVEARLRAEQ